MRNEDLLIVAFDKDPKDRDITILMVQRKESDKISIEKVFKGDKAEKLYKALLGEIEI